MEKIITSVPVVFFTLLAILIEPSLAQVPTHELVVENILAPQVLPGKSFNLTFTVRNAYKFEIENIYVQLQGGYPFLQISPTEAFHLDRLSPGESISISKFQLTVDSNAIAGDYTLNVILTYTAFEPGKTPYVSKISTERITITVSGKPEILLSVTASQPEKIRPGCVAKIALKASNFGTDIAKDIWIYPLDSYPFEVLWASQAIYVGDLSPKSAVVETIQVEVNESAEAKNWVLPIRMIYANKYGVATSKIVNLSVKLEPTAKFEIIGTSSDPKEIKPDDKGDRIFVQIKNKGTATAKEIKLNLRTDYPITPSGKTYYIDSLAPGETTTGIFHIDVDSDAKPQAYPVDVQISWTEGVDHLVDTKSTAILVSPSIYTRTYLIIGGIIGIIVIAAILLKRRKK